MAHTSPVEIARLVRQGVSLFFVFMLSAELPGQIFHLAQHLIWPGPGAVQGTLEHLGVLLAYLLALVSALFFAQQGRADRINGSLVPISNNHESLVIRKAEVENYLGTGKSW